jgi:hypothetical protein
VILYTFQTNCNGYVKVLYTDTNKPQRITWKRSLLTCTPAYKNCYCLATSSSFRSYSKRTMRTNNNSNDCRLLIDS